MPIDIYSRARVAGDLRTGKRDLRPKSRRDTERTVIANHVLAVGKQTKERNLSALLKKDSSIWIVFDYARSEDGTKLHLPSSQDLDPEARDGRRKNSIIRNVGIPERCEVCLTHPNPRALIVANLGRAYPGDDVHKGVAADQYAVTAVVAEGAHRIDRDIGALSCGQPILRIAVARTAVEDDASAAVDINSVANVIRDIQAVQINVLRIVYG